MFLILKTSNMILMYDKKIIIRPKNELVIYYLFMVIYRLGLDWSYKDVISVSFKYIGFTNNFTVYHAIFSWIILALFVVYIQRIYYNFDSNISNEVLYVLFIMSFVPFTTMICFGALDFLFIACNSFYWFFLLSIPRLKINNHKKIRFGLFKNQCSKEMQVELISVIFALIVIYISFKYANFRVKLSLTRVYDLRSEASEYNLPTVLSYMFSWTRSVNSILIVYYIIRKKWFWVIGLVIIQILNFSIDGLKSTFFLLVFALVISCIKSVKCVQINRIILVGISLINILSMVVEKITGNIMMVALFARRVLLIPVKISSNYFDFFRTNTPDYFRQSFLRVFGFKSPYPPISYYITEIYEKSSENSNNGLISDAMTNLGYVGIIIYPILLCMVLKALDNSAKGLDRRIYIIVALYTSLSLTNSFLLRALITHGVLITIFVLSRMKKNTDFNLVEK